jgi:hypothetical protein
MDPFWSLCVDVEDGAGGYRYTIVSFDMYWASRVMELCSSSRWFGWLSASRLIDKGLPGTRHGRCVRR